MQQLFKASFDLLTKHIFEHKLYSRSSIIIIHSYYYYYYHYYYYYYYYYRIHLTIRHA